MGLKLGDETSIHHVTVGADGLQYYGSAGILLSIIDSFPLYLIIMPLYSVHNFIIGCFSPSL